MERLSIIVPVYNAEKYLDICIKSILEQKYKEFEVICVNDGSTDRSIDILYKYQKIDHRIKVIEKENGGHTSARIAGMELAQGKYVAFVDSDDWIEDDMYEYLMKQIIQAGADIVTSGVYLEYESGRVEERENINQGVYRENLGTLFYPNMIDLNNFFGQNISMHIYNKIFKKDLIEKNLKRIPKEIIVGEDAAIIYPCFLEAKAIYVTDKIFYHYRMREDSVMGKNRKDIVSCKLLYEYLAKEFEKYQYTFLSKQLKLLCAYTILLTEPERMWKRNNLLPYSHLKRGSRIVLYGMGRFGKAFRKALEEKNNCTIVAIIDQNRKTDETGTLCYTLSEFVSMRLEYDYIVISILKRNICKEIKRELLQKGVLAERIIEPAAEPMLEVQMEEIF